MSLLCCARGPSWSSAFETAQNKSAARAALLSRTHGRLRASVSTLQPRHSLLGGAGPTRHARRLLFDAIMGSRFVRLRPILLTASAAMLGAVPIIAPIFSGLAWSLIFGLFASTLYFTRSRMTHSRPNDSL